MRPSRFSLPAVLFLFVLAALARIDSARAVLFYDTAEPAHNTTAPTGDYANSGWQYQGYYGSFLGTMISPNCFITGAHLGKAEPIPSEFISTAVLNGTGSTVTYTIDASANGGVGYWDIPNTDLRIFRVNETFPTYAQLYSGSDEIGKELVVLGRGAPRGADVVVNSALKGWQHVAEDGTPRWGRNVVSDTPNFTGLGSMLAAAFDATPGVDEAHLSTGDSGAGIFIFEDGVWKLAGVNYGVDGRFDTDDDHTSGVFDAALFDVGGLWVGSGASWQFVSDEIDNIPSSFYASRISTSRGAIAVVIAAAAVPEPGTIAMGLGALAVCVPWLVRRRRAIGRR